MKLTVQETADERGVTRQTVYEWIRKGLKHSKRREIGKKEHIVIDPKDVDDHLQLTEGD